MKPVILESPFKGDEEKNIKYARACMADMLKRGEAPFASHLLYTQDGVLDDSTKEERALGINAGFAFKKLNIPTVFYVDLGITDGMKEAIELCQVNSHEYEYRYLYQPKDYEIINAVNALGCALYTKNGTAVNKDDIFNVYDNVVLESIKKSHDFPHEKVGTISTGTTGYDKSTYKLICTAEEYFKCEKELSEAAWLTGEPQYYHIHKKFEEEKKRKADAIENEAKNIYNVIAKCTAKMYLRDIKAMPTFNELPERGKQMYRDMVKEGLTVWVSLF